MQKENNEENFKQMLIELIEKIENNSTLKYIYFIISTYLKSREV